MVQNIQIRKIYDLRVIQELGPIGISCSSFELFTN
uniref:Uncharacterized protein n=1 Tax=Oryza rufipogon TaxID=4529 RepID=A0A0E0Q4U7_ORYRU